MSRRKSRRLIVPVFIPNLGCSHRCIFCQQEKISGQSKMPINGDYVKSILDKAISSPRFSSEADTEVAFYGGTFTNLHENKMKELLNAVTPYQTRRLLKTIRISTRPDEIDEDRLRLLKDLNVSIIELGAQSMDNDVLSRCKRGHTADETVKAVSLLRKYGFKIGLQLIPGLPGDSETTFLKTIDKVIVLQPDMVRLYPAIVIRETELGELYLAGKYKPLTIDEAVQICHKSCLHLEQRGIPVIRIGLMSTPSLMKEGEILAGPWHTAFGFLVRSSIFHEGINHLLPNKGITKKIGVRMHGREIPLLRGYQNQGLGIIEKKTGARIIYVKADDSTPPREIRIDYLDET